MFGGAFVELFAKGLDLHLDDSLKRNAVSIFFLCEQRH